MPKNKRKPTGKKSQAKKKAEAKKQESKPMDIDTKEEKKVEEKKVEEKKPEEVPKDPRFTCFTDVQLSIQMIERGVVSKDRLLISRALRNLLSVRRRLSTDVLSELIARYIPKESPVQATLSGFASALKSRSMTEEDGVWREQLQAKEEEDQKQKEEEAKERKERDAERKKQLADTDDHSDKKKDDKKDDKKEGDDGNDSDDESALVKDLLDEMTKMRRMKEREKLLKEQEDQDAKDKAEALEKERLVQARAENDGVMHEVEMYISVLACIRLLDEKANAEAARCVEGAIARLAQPSFNRRSLDLLSAKVYFYYSLAHERLGDLVSIRSKLLELHRTSCLRHDEPSQAVLTNCILRNYLHYKLFSLADKFRLNTSMPETRSSTQYARYLFYLGQINSTQLHYSDAYTNLTQALRKAPQKGAVGFRQMATKFLVIVQLLMGEIPERLTFRQPALQRSLKPYFQLTQAVRVGDLATFKKVMNEHKQVFLTDRSYNLIVRLRQNVIKTGLRKINLSYSRISIKDICEKLSLDSETDAEYIIAKAISDGVIDAVIDKKSRFLFSKENLDIYSTTEPQDAFHKRIRFCLDIHNEATKALRFPNPQRGQTVEDSDEDFE